MMSWYAQPVQKNLEKLIETKPRLETIFQDPDFIPELKAFNPKLLEYITNTPELIRQAIEYIVVPPIESDSLPRKYRYPLLAVEMVETEAVCMLNSFFKPCITDSHSAATSNNSAPLQSEMIYLDLLFEILNQNEIMFLSASYFFRVCACLMTHKFKETTEYVYHKRPETLAKLLKHAENTGCANTLQLFLNMECSKAEGDKPAWMLIKVQIIKQALNRINSEAAQGEQSSFGVIQNLLNLLTEIAEKYFLIVDGREMLEPILSQNVAVMLLDMINSKNSLHSLPALGFTISLLNYYCFSSLNAEDKDNPNNTLKNIQRLDSQPLIELLNSNFEKLWESVLASPRFGLYQMRVLELLCHCVSLNSTIFLNTIRRVKFFASLIDLLYKYEEINIMHNLIEKTFHLVFVSPKQVHENYREHLFCEIDIIGRTAGVLIKESSLLALRKRCNFAHLMRVIKIYSGIQTINENIINAIKAYTELWTKVAIEIIKPYEELCIKELGSYNLDAMEIHPLQYKVKEITSFVPLSPAKALASSKGGNQGVEQEARFLRTQPLLVAPTNVDCLQLIPQIMDNDNFFKVPTQQSQTPIKQAVQSQQKRPVQTLEPPRPQLGQRRVSLDSSLLSSKQPDAPAPMQRAGSFSQTMEKIGKQVEEKMRTMRANSQERRLTPAARGNNTGSRIASPSPRRKQQNSWSSIQQEPKKAPEPAPKFQQPLPHVPVSKKPATAQSMIIDRKDLATEPTKRLNNGRDDEMAKSMVNLSELKNIKVKFASPASFNEAKKFRKVEQKDMILLNFLGIKIGK